MKIQSSFNDDNVLARFYGKSSNFTTIPNRLFTEYNVKKGLRNEDGTGVRVGLTRVSDVVGYKVGEDGKPTPCEGNLLFRGYSLKDLVANRKGNAGYEEVCFLLLFGYLPNRKEFEDFKRSLSSRYDLPDNFLVNEILRDPGKNLMNDLQTATLLLYNYDDNPDSTDVYQTLLKGINLIAKYPSIVCYSYQAKNHYYNRKSLTIHYPHPEYSIAENILYMLRPDGSFTTQEANLLDALLVIHADHGGGNNSTFTDRVVTSSGTDSYSVFAAALGSLKGPRHGGANLKVMQMMADIKENVKDWTDKDEVTAYLTRILNKDAFDHSGLIYGIGHAVYSISDPRAVILERFAKQLSEEKGRTEEMALYHLIEETAPQIIASKSRMYKGVSANVDFFSGFVYDMLDLPRELYTPIFAIARSVGWSAHRLEELARRGKIIRPAYIAVHDNVDYVPLGQRG